MVRRIVRTHFLSGILLTRWVGGSIIGRTLVSGVFLVIDHSGVRHAAGVFFSCVVSRLTGAANRHSERNGF